MSKEQVVKEFKWALALVGKAALNNLIVGEEARSWLMLDSPQAMTAKGDKDE